MSVEWSNELDILRDLALVQGCVPTDLAGAIAAGDKPESEHILEETEQEYFRDCVIGGDFERPNTGLITYMLDVVHQKEEDEAPKPKRERNIAMKSLLEMQRKNSLSNKNSNFDLKKPMESRIGVYKDCKKQSSLDSDNSSIIDDRNVNFKETFTKVKQKKPPTLEFNPSEMFVKRKF